MSLPKSVTPQTINRGTILTFGKYSGQTAEEIVSRDPGYIIWLSNEIGYSIEAKLLTLAVELNVSDEEDYDIDNYPLDEF